MNKHTRRLVVDVDDTISTHVNGDYENAKPHLDIIAKLNSLFDDGWEIHYVTARGQLSCNGDQELINKIKRPVLEKWMRVNGVKFSSLSFEKKLAQWYIDDKALTPEDFMDMKIEKLHGGSGAGVERQGDRVIKVCSNARDQANWYQAINAMSNASRMQQDMKEYNIIIPKLHSIIDDTLNIDYIEGELLCDHINTLSDIIDGCDNDILTNIVEWIESYSNISQIHKHIGGLPGTYINRLYDHINAMDDLELKAICFELLDPSFKYYKVFEMDNSFYHGDLALGNIIIQPQEDLSYKLGIFDPNTPSNVWGNYLLDYAKLMQSIVYDYEYDFMNAKQKPEPYVKNTLWNLLSSRGIYSEVQYLCATHFIRMYKYKKTKIEKNRIKEIIISIHKDLGKD